MNADGGAMRMEKSSVTGPPRGSQVSAPLGALPSPLTPGAPDRAQAPSTSRCSEALVPTTLTHVGARVGGAWVA